MTLPLSHSTDRECPHGLRPGTTVCLHCRHEARVAARQRRYRMAARAGLGVVGTGIVVVLVVGAWKAIVPDADDPSRSASVSGSVAQAATATSTRRDASAAVLVPTMAEGRRELGDSMFAVREGAQVTVHFDTETLRTRFDWKFEGVVRATLPLVFGPTARAALDSVPAGMLAGGADLMNDLPTRGIPLKVGGSTLRVWPVTRAGRDGPIVVAYRAAVSR